MFVTAIRRSLTMTCVCLRFSLTVLDLMSRRFYSTSHS